MLVMGGLLIVMLVAALIWLPVRMARAEAAVRAQHPGTLTVAACTYERGQKGYVTAVCTGDFRSDDGSVVATGVTVRFQRSSDIETTPMTGRHWRAWLGGADDPTADLAKPAWTTWAWVLLAEAGLLAWLTAQVVWLSRRIRRRHAPTGTAARSRPG
jgi:hypothetical protein